MRYGARHLKRAIERDLVQPLSNLMATIRSAPEIRSGGLRLTVRTHGLREGRQGHPALRDGRGGPIGPSVSCDGSGKVPQAATRGAPWADGAKPHNGSSGA